MKKLFLMIGVVLVVSCKSDPERPADILTKEQMTAALIDVYILEAQIKDLDVVYDSAKVVYNILEPRVFERHGITDSSYRKSYLYYLDRPVEMDEIYSAVVDSLSLREKLVR